MAVIKTLLPLLIISRIATALIAYDCKNHLSNISTISLRNVAVCPDPETSYKNEKTTVTVLQRNEVKLIQVLSCYVEERSQKYFCGMHSHSSIVAGSLKDSVRKLGAEECRNVHRFHSLNINGQTIADIKPNATTAASITLLGQLDNKGTCTGTTYTENGHTWDSIVIVAAIKIQIQDYLAIVKMEENEVVLHGGITCPFTPGYCFDSQMGESLWNSIPDTNCENQFTTLYKGEAEKVINKINKEELIIVEQGGKIFALSVQKQISICHLQAWQTEHPRIIILEGRQQEASNTLLPQNTDLTAYVNSKFLYIEQAYKRALEELYVNTVHRRCLLHREILKNRLLMAPIQPNVISQYINENHQEGYTGRVLGEVLYIIKCAPMIVQLRKTEECYNELPIAVNNISKFMAPLTRIIQDRAEQIDCNSVTPALYQINEEWIGMSPFLTIKKRPQELAAESKPTIEFTQILPLGDQGIYTRDQASSVQKILTFGSERKAVENLLIRKVAGQNTDDQGISTLNLFNKEEMKNIAKSTIRQIYGWFEDVGLFFSGIIGIYMIFQILRYILEVIINALQLYRTVGGGLKLLACFWNAATMWLLHTHNTKSQKRSRKQQIVEEGEEEEEEDIPLEEIITINTNNIRRATTLPTLRNFPMIRESQEINEVYTGNFKPNQKNDSLYPKLESGTSDEETNLKQKWSISLNEVGADNE